MMTDDKMYSQDNARIPAAVASCVEAVPLRFCSLNKSFVAGG
ncbi:hypothetical protein Tco_0967690, partial [Tanacetum coccineum]